MIRRLALALAVAVLLAGPASAAETAETTTTTTLVSPAPPAEAVLAVGDEAEYRAALAALSVDAGGPHTIDLRNDITLDDGTDPTYTGSQELTIDGHGHVLDAGGTSRVLVMDSPADARLVLFRVTLQGGLGAGDGGAVLVENASTVQLTDARFVDNQAAGGGGAIALPGTALVERSDFLGNTALAGDGGAIDAAAAEGPVTIQLSNFDGNRAPAGSGGAVSAIGFPRASADTGVQGSTFTDNAASEGGALVVGRGVVVANSTFVGNRASTSGGAILRDGDGLSALVYVTATGNVAPEGANLTNRGDDLYVFFSVLAEPQGGENCAFLQGSFQLDESRVDDDSCPGARRVEDVGLGPLSDNGGRTLTREPIVGSPLIDAVEANYGYPTIPGGCALFQGIQPFDQRSVQRPQDGDGETRTETQGPEPTEVAADCDIGAVEADAFVAPPPPPAPPAGPVAAGPAFTG